jgi:glycosyltransferase involved in cell wall biosynthesis
MKANNAKQKIILLSDLHPEIELGGGGAIAFEFYQELRALGINSDFWFTKFQYQHLQDQDSNCLSFDYSYPNRRFFQKIVELFGGLILLKILGRILLARPKLVWLHQIGNRIPYLLIPLLRLLRISTVITLHDYLPLSKYKIGSRDQIRFDQEQSIYLDLHLSKVQKVRKYLFTRFVNCANSRIAVSDLQARVLRSEGININKVISNGVLECNHDLSALRNVRDEKHILFAGRLNGKGLDMICEAIQESNDKWTLHLAGNQDLLDFCNREYSHIPTRYHGRLSRLELCALMHQVDIVSVLSQYLDPYPTVSLEALAHGTFYITTPTSGTSKILIDLNLEELLIPLSQIPSLDKIYEKLKNSSNTQFDLPASVPQPKEVTLDYLKHFDSSRVI